MKSVMKYIFLLIFPSTTYLFSLILRACMGLVSLFFALSHSRIYNSDKDSK